VMDSSATTKPTTVSWRCGTGVRLDAVAGRARD
jgi:hypothetical protein